MSEDEAIDAAIEALGAQIKVLAIDADLHDIWSEPQPTELITCDFRTPRRIAASKKRARYRLAIVALQQKRPRQSEMELEASL